MQFSWISPFLTRILRSVFHSLCFMPSYCNPFLSGSCSFFDFASQIFLQLWLKLQCFRFTPIQPAAPHNSASIATRVPPALVSCHSLGFAFIFCPTCLHYWVESWNLSPKFWVNVRRIKMAKRIFEIVKYSKNNNHHFLISGVLKYIHRSVAQLLFTVSVNLRTLLHRYCHIAGFPFRIRKAFFLDRILHT